MRPLAISAALEQYRNRLFAVLAAACVLAVFCYGAFLLLAVAHTAARTAAERELRELRAQAGDLETQYLESVRELTPERAVQLGFVSPERTSVVYADAARELYTLR